LMADDRMILCGTVGSPMSTGWTNFFLRLLPDGQIDPSFHSTAEGMSCLLPLANGQLIIGNAVIDSVYYPLARLNNDGTFDPTFKALDWASNSLSSTLQLAADPEGKTLLTGFFSDPPDRYEYKLARVNQDGSLDETFHRAPLTDYSHDSSGVMLSCLLVQTDGKILVGGHFAYADGLGRTNLARFNADGSVDPVFAPAFPPDGLYDYGRVQSLALEPDNKILVAGRFLAINGVNRNGLARLNPDGSLDPQFYSGQEIPGSFPLEVYSMARQPDGGILLGCNEYTLFDLEPRCGLVRINGTRVAAPRWISATWHPPGGKMRLRFFAPPGTTHWIQVCTNLQDWITIGSAIDLGGGVFEFEDAQSAILETRFYRLLLAE
jgi:uncharacterized delta-60 repeat protein